MTYEFEPRREEPQPSASGSRRGVPPRKHIGVGLLEPPYPQTPQPLRNWNLLPRLFQRLRKLLPR